MTAEQFIEQYKDQVKEALLDFQKWFDLHEEEYIHLQKIVNDLDGITSVSEVVDN